MARHADIKTDLRVGDWFFKAEDPWDASHRTVCAHYVVIKVCRTHVKMLQVLPVDEYDEFDIDHQSFWRLRSHWEKMKYTCMP